VKLHLAPLLTARQVLGEGALGVALHVRTLEVLEAGVVVVLDPHAGLAVALVGPFALLAALLIPDDPRASLATVLERTALGDLAVLEPLLVGAVALAVGPHRVLEQLPAALGVRPFSIADVFHHAAGPAIHAEPLAPARGALSRVGQRERREHQ
jgi:hypothetical protein